MGPWQTRTRRVANSLKKQEKGRAPAGSPLTAEGKKRYENPLGGPNAVPQSHTDEDRHQGIRA